MSVMCPVPKSPVIRHAAIWHPFPFLCVYSTNSKQTSETHFGEATYSNFFLLALTNGVSAEHVCCWQRSGAATLHAVRFSGNAAFFFKIKRLGNLLHEKWPHPASHELTLHFVAGLER